MGILNTPVSQLPDLLTADNNNLGYKNNNYVQDKNGLQFASANIVVSERTCDARFDRVDDSRHDDSVDYIHTNTNHH